MNNIFPRSSLENVEHITLFAVEISRINVWKQLTQNQPVLKAIRDIWIKHTSLYFTLRIFNLFIIVLESF